MTDNLLILCVYTQHSSYELEAQRLASDAAQHGYVVRQVPVPPQGDWRRNAAVKATVVQHVFREHHGPLLLLDADCRILGPLDEMLALARRVDVAAKYRPGYCFSALFNSGVVLLQKTPASAVLVDDWADRASQFGHLHRFADQAMLAEALVLGQGNLRFEPLPERLHAFPTANGAAPPGCVILHAKQPKSSRSVPAGESQWPVPTGAAPLSARLVSYGPSSPPADGRPMSGVAGANRDFAEYAARYGAAHPLYMTVPGAEGDWASLERHRLAALGNLLARVPNGTSVIVADFDTILLRDPRVLLEPLAEADLVLPWDAEHSEAVPTTSVLAMTAVASVTERLLPLAEYRYQHLRRRIGTRATPALALADALRSGEAGVRWTTVPAHTVSELRAARRQTVAVLTRGTLAFQPGDRPCPSPSMPRPLATALPLTDATLI